MVVTLNGVRPFMRIVRGAEAELTSDGGATWYAPTYRTCASCGSRSMVTDSRKG